MEAGPVLSEVEGTIQVGMVQVHTGIGQTHDRFFGREIKGGSIAPRDELHLGADTVDHFENIPYAAGLLQAYAQRHAAPAGRYRFLLPLFRRLPVDEAVSLLESADVVGFSIYVWNARHTLAIARRLKERRPDVLTVFGGPQAPGNAELFLRQHPYVDLVCRGEGEAVFCRILEHCENRDWRDIPSVSYLDADGTCVQHPLAPRIADLSTIPSPYLEGIFDPLMQANPHEKWMGLWETNRGCPFSCSFCSWAGVSSRVYKFDMDRVCRELEWMGQHKMELVFCCDANFGILPRDLDIVRYAAQVRQQYGFPQNLPVENTKNAPERAFLIQKTLADARMLYPVSLSLQSLSPVVLENVRRHNISLASYEELQHRYTREGIDTYTDLILGLPGETFESFAQGISDIIANGQHSRMFFYNCQILPNAEMGDPAYQARFGLQIVEQQIVPSYSSVTPTPDEVPEFIQMIVGSDAMPAADWVRAKSLWWTVDFAYYDRLLHVPFTLAHGLYGASYRLLFAAISDVDPAQYPVLAEVQALFQKHAAAIQQGGPEYYPAPDWLNTWWPLDQVALIKLAAENKVGEYIREAEAAVAAHLLREDIPYDPLILHEAFVLNRELLRLPFTLGDYVLTLGHNIVECYRAILRGQPVQVRVEDHAYQIVRTRPIWLSWDDWYEHVIFCDSTKPHYLHSFRPLSVSRQQRVQIMTAHDRTGVIDPGSLQYAAQPTHDHKRDGTMVTQDDVRSTPELGGKGGEQRT